jgi:hypothetical protein
MAQGERVARVGQAGAEDDDAVERPAQAAAIVIVCQHPAWRESDESKQDRE